MHGQIHNMIGKCFYTTILSLFGHACNDFVEKCVKFGGPAETSRAGRKKEIEGLS